MAFGENKNFRFYFPLFCGYSYVYGKKKYGRRKEKEDSFKKDSKEVSDKT